VAQLIALLGIPASIRVFTNSGTYPTVTNGDVRVMSYAQGGGGSGEIKLRRGLRWWRWRRRRKLETL
jgi:hypothetical protein